MARRVKEVWGDSGLSEVDGVNSGGSLAPRRRGLGRHRYSQSGSPAPGRIAAPSPSASARGGVAGRDPGRGPE